MNTAVANPTAEIDQHGWCSSAQPPLFEQLMSISRDSALEEMASGIAHELNQPLGAILTFAQAGERLLKRPDASLASACEVFELIGKEALAAAAGIRRMRRLFQRDASPKSPCAMADVVRETCVVLELLAAQAHVQLDVDIDEELAAVDIHRLRVQHVLFTLVHNAIDAVVARATTSSSGTTPPRVTITVRGDRYNVETSVIDNGCGIPLEERREIFQPFFTTKSHGTGLGLASARAIVESHEGTIGFEPHGNQGTRFWFRLPASAASGPLKTTHRTSCHEGR